MDIKRIRYAIALAEELNFARAAEKVNLSQPALSRSIQTLEEELGLMLFDRDNRNVALTTVGAVFLEQARRLIYQLRSMERDMKLIRGGEIGQVAFGVGPLPTAGMLPQLLRQIRQERPALQLKVVSHNWRYLLKHLRAEEIEFFVSDVRDVPPDADITLTPLCRQYGPFICRPGHPLLKNAARRPSDMVPYGLASLTLPMAMQRIFRQLLEVPPHEPLPIMLECDNLSALQGLARSSDVILLATEASVADDIRDGLLVPLAFDNLPPLYADMGIVQLHGRTFSPGAALVLDHLRKIAAAAPATAIYQDGAFRAVPA